MPVFIKKYAHLYILLFVGIVSTGNMAFTDFIGDDIGRIVVRDYLFKQGFATTLNEMLGDRPLLMLTIWLNYITSGLVQSYKEAWSFQH